MGFDYAGMALGVETGDDGGEGLATHVEPGGELVQVEIIGDRGD